MIVYDIYCSRPPASGFPGFWYSSIFFSGSFFCRTANATQVRAGLPEGLSAALKPHKGALDLMAMKEGEALITFTVDGFNIVGTLPFAVAVNVRAAVLFVTPVKTSILRCNTGAVLPHFNVEIEYEYPMEFLQYDDTRETVVKFLRELFSRFFHQSTIVPTDEQTAAAAGVESDDRDARFYLCQFDSLEPGNLIRSIADGEELRTQTVQQYTTLEAPMAAQHAQFKAMMAALEAGTMDINAQDADGRSVLHLACDVADQIGTGIWQAKGNHVGELAHNLLLILEMGANPILCDYSGRRPVDLATADPRSPLSLAFLRYQLLHEPRINRLPRLSVSHFELDVDYRDRCLQFALSGSHSTIGYYITQRRQTLQMVDMATGVVHSVYQSPGGEPLRFLVIPPADAIPRSCRSDLLLTSTGVLLNVTHGGTPVVSSVKTPVRFMVSDGELQGLAALYRPSHLVTLARKVRKKVLGEGNTATRYLDDLESEICRMEKTIPHQEHLAITDDEVGFAESVLLYPYGSAATLKESKASVKLPPEEEPPMPEEPQEEKNLPVGLLAVVASSYEQAGAQVDTGERPRLVVMQLPLYMLPPPALADARSVTIAFGEMLAACWYKAHGEEEEEFCARDTSGVGPYCEGHAHPMQQAPVDGTFSLTTGDRDSILCFSSYTDVCRYDAALKTFTDVRIPHPCLPAPTAFAGACTMFANGQHYVLLCGDSAFVLTWPECKLVMYLKDGDPEGDALTAAVCPSRPHLAVLLRDSDLCFVDIAKGTCRVVATVMLSSTEMAQKRADLDVDPSELPTAKHTLSGDHFLRFSHDGEYVTRFNQHYGKAAVYRWDELATLSTQVSRMTPVFTSVVDYPSCDDLEERRLKMCDVIGPAEGKGVKRSVPKSRLKGYLKAYASRTASIRNQKAQFSGILGCVHEGTVDPNFRDKDGRTALHLLALNAFTYPDEAELLELLTALLGKGGNLFCCDDAGVRPVDMLLPAPDPLSPASAALLADPTSPVSGTPPLGALGRCLVKYRKMQEDVHLGHTDGWNIELKPLAELGDHCDQVVFSASQEKIVFFRSKRRAALIMLNVASGFSVEINQEPLDAAMRFAVVPYCSAVHTPGGDRDYLLFSDGTLHEVRYSAGLDAVPEVRTESTGLTFDTDDGHPIGFCAALHWTPRAHTLSPDDDLGAAEFLMGTLLVARTVPAPHPEAGARKLMAYRLGSVLYREAEQGFTFLSRTLRFAAEQEPEDAFALADAAAPAQAASCGPCCSLAALEGAQPVAYLHSGVTSVADPLGVSLWLPLTPPEGAGEAFLRKCSYTAGAAASAHEGVVYLAHFSKGLDVYSVYPLDARVDARTLHGGPVPAREQQELKHLMSFAAGDNDAELVSGAFHPVHTNLLVFLKEGDLCVLDVATETCRVLSSLHLGNLELGRKAADGDDPADTGPSGVQLLSFSCRGSVLQRHNTFYQSFTLYAWADIQRIWDTARAADMPHTTYAFLPGHVDPTWRVRRPVRKEQLRGFLAQLSTRPTDYHARRGELHQLLQGLRANIIGANFADADGQTPLHLLCELAPRLQEPEVARVVPLLLNGGASLYACNNAGARPVDGLPDILRGYIRRHVEGTKTRDDSRSAPEHPHGKARIPGLHAVPQDCAQVVPSATRDNVLYVLRQELEVVPADAADPLQASTPRLSGSASLYLYDAGARTLHRLYDFAASVAAKGDKLGLCVCPHYESLHGLGRPAEADAGPRPVDFLLLSSGQVVFVDHADPGNCRVRVSESGGAFDVGLAADAHDAHCQCPSAATAGCALVWDAALLHDLTAHHPLGGHSLQPLPPPLRSDMVGSLLYLAPLTPQEAAAGAPASARRVRCLRVPSVAYSDMDPSKYLSTLLTMSSPMECPLPAPVDLPSPLQSTAALVLVDCQGVFWVQPPNCAPTLVTVRGVSLGAPAGLPLGLGPATGVAATYFMGRRYVAVFTEQSLHLLELTGLPSDNDLRTREDLTTGAAKCREVFFFADPDNAGGVCGAFHPRKRNLLLFLKRGELFCLDVATRACATLGYMTLEDAEAECRRRDGGGPGERGALVGDQSLAFTCDGRRLVRHNHLYGRAVLYEFDALERKLQRFAQPPDMESNVFHLEPGLFGRVAASGSAAYDALYREPVPKQSLPRYLRRLSTARGRYSAKVHGLMLAVGAIMKGVLPPNAVDFDGRTALHLVGELSQHSGAEEAQSALRLLLSVGASLYLCDPAGVRPLDLLLATGKSHNPVAAARSLIAYRARHYPFTLPRQRFSPIISPQFPGCARIWEVSRAATHAAPSSVQSNIVYCMMVDGAVWVADPRLQYFRTLIAADVAKEYGPSFVVLPTTATADDPNVDMLLFSYGELVVVHLPEDIEASAAEVQTVNTTISFEPDVGYAAVGMPAACSASWGPTGNGVFACVTSNDMGPRFVAMELHFPKPWAEVTRLEKMDYLAKVLMEAWVNNKYGGFRKGFPNYKIGDKKYTVCTSLNSAVCNTYVDSRSRTLLWHKAAPTHYQEMPVQCQHVMGISAALMPQEGSKEEALAVFSHTLDVSLVAEPVPPTEEGEEPHIPSRRKLWLAGNQFTQDAAMFGCFHPKETHVLAFVKDSHLCTFDFLTGFTSILCFLEPAEMERETCDTLEIVGHNRMFFSCDGLWLIRLNVDADRVVAYRWDIIQSLAAKLRSEGPVVNNCVYLPAKVGAMDLAAVGAQLEMEPQLLDKY